MAPFGLKTDKVRLGLTVVGGQINQLEIFDDGLAVILLAILECLHSPYDYPQNRLVLDLAALRVADFDAPRHWT